LPGDPKYTTMNYTKLNTYGFEINTSVNMINRDFSHRLIKYIYINYSYINTDKNSGDYISVYTLDYLKHKLSARLGHRIYKSLNLSWNLTLQKRNGTYPVNEDVENEYSLFFLANARLYWKPKYVELYLEAANIFNTKYRDFGSVIQPGRWIFAGMNIDLNFSPRK